MNIDDAVAFFREFLTALYEQDVANLTEPDDQLEQRVARTESFMYSSPGTSMTSPFMRPRSLPADELAEIAAKASTPVRRPLYLVVEYDVPGWGTCFTADVGGGEETNYIAYGYQYRAMEVDGEPKIVAQYGIDFYAEGLAWENIAGAVIEPLGDPVAVRALEEPRIPRDRDYYQGIVASAPQDGA
ncbi:hypothetical protein FNH09_42230 [Streptomyces adustus]|uniref:Uncharacterized protein n=1 Tax=Streptomyces adustus TaxID=1609272 RepID=A0A5N8VQN1_9ACTN|nr:hypothetical protein [Streptomyces adustus]MPY37591.1 hypothetical protein [Streptomyces adustus]